MKTYTREIDGIKRTFQYSDEDAKALGLVADPEPKTKAKTPANKSRTVQNKKS